VRECFVCVLERMSPLNKMRPRSKTRRGCKRNAPVVRRAEAGQAIVVVALALVAILGILGLATDIGYLRYTKRQLQTAADAAAMAGAAELAYGDVTSAAQADSAANGFTNGTNGATVTVNNPPLSGQHVGNSSYVEAIVSKITPTFFAKAFGVKTVTLQARAVADLGSGNNCIFALDPAASGALSVDALASISSQCGIVVESTSSSALSCSLLSAISATSIGVVGGVKSSFCSLSPNPVTGITTPIPNDPLAYLAKPAVGSCTFTSQQNYTSANSPPAHPSTLNPGIYCGGIQIQPGASVVFNPGVYILTSGGGKGGLTVDIGTNVTTNTSISPYGVTFYNYGPIGGINFNFTSFIGSSSYNTSLQGSYYLPKASVVFAFSGNVKYDILVADKIEFAYLTFGQGSFTGSGFSKDYTSLATGSPVKGNGVLVE
jgi:Flp pilus assembly protein TadG